MSDTRTGQGRIRGVVIRDDPTELTVVDGRRSILATGLALLATCVLLFLIWQTVSSLPIVFGASTELTGALYGVMGIALAMPLVAIGRVAIVRFYVEDNLGGNPEQSTEDNRKWVTP